MNVVAARRGMQGLAGFLLSAAMVLWRPVLSFGLSFGFSVDGKPSGLETAVALAPAGACVLVVASTLWLGIRHHQRPFALGLLLGTAFALAVFAMYFVAARVAA